MRRHIDLHQLRCFVAVGEELSFRRAAERLHMTQPPLSRQVRQLEDALGVQLLERDRQATRLTPAGAQALRRFTTLLRQVDTAIEAVTTPLPRTAQRLRIGLPWWLDLSGFARFEATVVRTTPWPGVEPQVGLAPQNLDALLAGRLDFALIAPRPAIEGLTIDAVAQLPLMAALPAAHPLARKRRLHLRELEAIPNFLRATRADNALQWQAFDDLYRRLGFAPRRFVASKDPLATFGQIAAGRGCTVLPAPLAQRPHPGVAYRHFVTAERLQIELALLGRPEWPPALRRTVLRAVRGLTGLSRSAHARA
jgi:LysR family transcriptional regulator, benzoate and cis,cis-muconate-responsive activator of ben and cat genes